MEKIIPVRRLPLQGAKNTRDLGGYACEGGVTRWGAFLRSDNPGQLTGADVEYLRRYGVREVVDLRREDEAQRNPSLLCGAEGFKVHSVSLNDELNEIDFEGDLPGSMAGMYMLLLDEGGKALVRAFEAFAAAEGGALFHCAVGKDRTGVIAMLLLKLAGVADYDVVADYAVTDIYMTDIFDAQAQVFRDNHIPDFILHSRPASMRRLLKHLQECYGSAERYLLQAGLAPESIAVLKERLVEKAPGA